MYGTTASCAIMEATWHLRWHSLAASLQVKQNIDRSRMFTHISPKKCRRNDSLHANRDRHAALADVTHEAILLKLIFQWKSQKSKGLTCCAREKPYSLAIANMAMLRTMRSMLHSARVRARGMVSLLKKASAEYQIRLRLGVLNGLAA